MGTLPFFLNGVSMTNRRFELFEYRQVLVRMRQVWTAVRIRHQMAASIRNAKRFLFCRAVRCLLLMASMGGIGCVGRSPKGECRRTRRGSFQEGVTQESGCGRRRPTAEETGPTPA
ncbi:hypothetical protein AYM40_36255 (plasmid) [Paraburkholderia phytofirmans OLGA172]|uniref:Uncharacterized protein n=1 Tax=Paraburkholderia phytofirmans OLGA172 TaxID=1417228 RepID=A0A160FWY7_9BURK|nr:hypothetical protein AYM40_36255 [Paraburkholderia phytofirmans OLGA172]